MNLEPYLFVEEVFASDKAEPMFPAGELPPSLEDDVMSPDNG